MAATCRQADGVPGPAAWDVFAGAPAIGLLMPDEAAAVGARVLAAQDAWTERRPFEVQNHVFHTLGAATYLDAAPAYTALAGAANPVLGTMFADLQDRVAATIATATGYPAQAAEGLALPGFHIYRGNAAAPTGLRFGGTIHVDRPHARHRFACPIDATLSFTLPLVLPAAGGGMFWWRDVPPALMQATPVPYTMPAPVFDWFDRHKRRIDYTAGALVLHDGTTVHQVANDRPTDDTEWRITMQGHGVLGDGFWRLFF